MNESIGFCEAAAAVTFPPQQWIKRGRDAYPSGACLPPSRTHTAPAPPRRSVCAPGSDDDSLADRTVEYNHVSYLASHSKPTAWVAPPSFPLAQQLLDHRAAGLAELFVAALMKVGEGAVIQPEQVQKGHVQILDGMNNFYCLGA